MARQLARTVASNGGCDRSSFEDFNFNRARDTWVFTCQKPEGSFEIVAYGSQEVRSTGIKALDDRNATYFTKNFYSVVVVGPYPYKVEDPDERARVELLIKGSWDLALASFKE